MVHLSRVRRDTELQRRHRRQADESRSEIASPYVYGTQYAIEELPEHAMHEHQMPAEVASRMIKDELSLDGNPLLKYFPPPFYASLAEEVRLIAF